MSFPSALVLWIVFIPIYLILSCFLVSLFTHSFSSSFFSSYFSSSWLFFFFLLSLHFPPSNLISHKALTYNSNSKYTVRFLPAVWFLPFMQIIVMLFHLLNQCQLNSINTRPCMADLQHTKQCGSSQFHTCLQIFSQRCDTMLSPAKRLPPSSPPTPPTPTATAVASSITRLPAIDGSPT